MFGKHRQADLILAFVVTVVPACGLTLVVALWCYNIPPTRIDLALFSSMYILSLVGVEVGYHRFYAHNSFQTSCLFRKILAILGSMAFQGPVIWWVAIHRRHHEYSDKDGDPHSPNLTYGNWRTFRGFLHAQSGWLFDPSCTRPEGLEQYVKDLFRDRELFVIHRQYGRWLTLGFAIPTIAGLISGGVVGAATGFLYGGVLRVFFTNNVFWLINSASHKWGTRRFATRDLSTNNIWLSLPTIGQAWHNNHHAFPNSSVVGFHWWEIDIAGYIIRTLATFGIVWNLKIPTEQQMNDKRQI